MAFRALLLVSVGVQELKGIYQALLISHEKEGAPTRAINTRFIQPTYKSMMKIEFGRRVLQWGVSLSLVYAHEKVTWRTRASFSLTHSLTDWLFISDGKVNQQGYYCVDAVSSLQECLCLVGKYYLLLFLSEGKEREREELHRKLPL